MEYRPCWSYVFITDRTELVGKYAPRAKGWLKSCPKVRWVRFAGQLREAHNLHFIVILEVYEQHVGEKFQLTSSSPCLPSE